MYPEIFPYQYWYGRPSFDTQTKREKNLWPLFMDGVQLPQG